MSPTRLYRSLFAALALTVAFGATSTLFVATPAQATGYGVYLDYALGDVDYNDNVLFLSGYDTGRIGAGLAIDTAVAKDQLFNYRMNLGYEQVRGKADGAEFGRWNGGSFENIFGFGVYRSPLMRVWLGPSLRIASGVLDNDQIAGSVVELVGGGGIAAGVNVHTGDIGSAAFTIGYQYAYHGQFRSDAFGGIPGYVHGTEQRVNFNFAWFFRGKGDRFEKK